MSYGFGIIGCGMISKFHAKAIADVPGAKLVACFDTLPDAADRFAERNGLQGVSQFRRNAGRQGRSRSSPSARRAAAHLEPAVAAAKAGKHVIVEKPLEITLKQCDAIIRACEKNDVKLSTIFPSRFHDVEPSK